MSTLAGLFESHYYSTLHFVLIVTHVLGALFALVVAPVALITRKGGAAHRAWGKAYFWGMFVTNSTALILLTWRFNIFLLGVTLISFYSALTGYRVLYRKRAAGGDRPTRFDWSLSWGVLTAGVALALWGVLTGFGITQLAIPNDGGVFSVYGILPVVFGLLIAQSTWADLRIYRTPSTDRHWWWYYHMDRMVGSYIGLLTALMVQQVGPRLPDSLAWMVWVAPTLIGSPAIAYWIGHYRRKFAAATARAQAAAQRQLLSAG